MLEAFRAAGLSQRLRWAITTVSEIATELLEADETKLSAQAFDVEVQLSKLHNKLIERLRQAPALAIRDSAARELEQESLPF